MSDPLDFWTSGLDSHLHCHAPERSGTRTDIFAQGPTAQSRASGTPALRHDPPRKNGHSGDVERTTRAWSNPMLPFEGPGCFVYLSSSRSTVGVAQCGVFVFVALVRRCRHMLLHVGRSDRWFSLPIICRCWSLSLVQIPVEPALRLAWHAQPTDSPRLPRFQERGFCHSRQRRDT